MVPAGVHLAAGRGGRVAAVDWSLVRGEECNGHCQRRRATKNGVCVSEGLRVPTSAVGCTAICKESDMLECNA